MKPAQRKGGDGGPSVYSVFTDLIKAQRRVIYEQEVLQ